METPGSQRWVQRLADAGVVVGLGAGLAWAGDWSGIQLAAAWGLWGLAIGASQQGHKPTTPGSRRIFAALFALTCVIALVVGGELAPALMTLVGAWTIGLGFAASFDPHDNAPVKRSFSGQVIRRG